MIDFFGSRVDVARALLRRMLLRPMVVLTARVMGPGPARLRMVKLAHNLNAGRLTVVPVEEGAERFELPAVQPTSRAA